MESQCLFSWSCHYLQSFIPQKFLPVRHFYYNNILYMFTPYLLFLIPSNCSSSSENGLVSKNLWLPHSHPTQQKTQACSYTKNHTLLQFLHLSVQRVFEVCMCIIKQYSHTGIAPKLTRAAFKNHPRDILRNKNHLYGIILIHLTWNIS